MVIAELIAGVKEVGFPIVVSLYTLVRLEGTVKANTEAITALTVEIAKKKK